MSWLENLIGATQSATGGSSLAQLLQGFGQGIPGALQGPANFLNRNQIGTRGITRGVPIQQRPIVNPEFMRPDYSGAGERARRFQEYRTGRDIPGANTDYSARLNASSVPAALVPGSAIAAPIDPYAAQNRAYQQERARVEAMVKANPDMQKQEIADARAKVRDQGMAIWAAKNPELAKKLQPGQVGYDAIQSTLAGNMARAGQGFGMTEQLVPTPQGFPTQVPGLPTGAGYSTGFGMTTNLAPGAQTPPPYSTIRPSSELSGLGASPLGTAQTSTFGQPNVMDPEQFEKLLKMVQK